jgi:hypothetical protein
LKAQFNYDAMRTIPAFTSVASADNELRMMDDLESNAMVGGMQMRFSRMVR